MDRANAVANKASKELLDAQAHICSHTFAFLNSMALKCAIQLGIPDAIHKHGKPMTLSQLISALPRLHPNKAPSLHRLLRLLVHSNFLSQQKIVNSNTEEVGFTLTTNSELLLKDNPLTLAPFVLALLDPTMTNPSHHLSCWFENNDESPFHTAHGKSLWEHASQAPMFNMNFNEAMASDARFLASLLENHDKFKGLFEGIETLVDVGGGDGSMAKAIAKAYSWLKCVMVLDLPHVVDGLQDNACNSLAYVGGDMFEAIPSADAILFKWILHDWSDDNCIKILQRCKEAIPSKNQGGKVIIIDIMVESPNDTVKPYSNTQILFDLEMLAVTVGGKERTEEEWKKLFTGAGFNEYEIFSILGSRSVIVLYP